MSEVTRYSGSIRESAVGSHVKYEDYVYLRAQRDALAEELAKLQKKYEQADVERGLMACLVMESWEAKQVMADRDEYELAKQIMAQHALAAAPEAGKP